MHIVASASGVASIGVACLTLLFLQQYFMYVAFQRKMAEDGKKREEEMCRTMTRLVARFDSLAGSCSDRLLTIESRVKSLRQEVDVLQRGLRPSSKSTRCPEIAIVPFARPMVSKIKTIADVDDEEVTKKIEDSTATACRTRTRTMTSKTTAPRSSKHPPAHDNDSEGRAASSKRPGEGLPVPCSLASSTLWYSTRLQASGISTKNNAASEVSQPRPRTPTSRRPPFLVRSRSMESNMTSRKESRASKGMVHSSSHDCVPSMEQKNIRARKQERPARPTISSGSRFYSEVVKSALARKQAFSARDTLQLED